MKNLFLTITFLLSVGALIGQSYGEIQGKISDKNGKPIPFTNVYVKTVNSTLGATTDLDGKFKIKPLLEGEYQLNVTNLEYNTLIINKIRVFGDKTTRMFDIKLAESTTEIPVCDIEYIKIKLIDPEETSVRTIDDSYFEHSPASKDITKIITSVVPGITTGNNGEVYFRGTRSGSSVYYIDGVKIKGGGIPSIPSSGLSTIKVYTGGVPAKYGDTTGGVIVIETKNFFTEYNKRKYASH